MRALPALILLIALGVAGCSKEPDFDQRYEQHAAQLEATASNMQADVDRQIAASQAAGGLSGNETAPVEATAP
jgi:PBP1b-binding outer membrane lipoprotein LpoB